MMRRRTLICSAMWCAAGASWAARSLADEPGAEPPHAGDKLAAAERSGPAVALTLADIAVGASPRVAYPMDAIGGGVRDGSRLNKILLIRVPAESLTAADPG